MGLWEDTIADAQTSGLYLPLQDNTATTSLIGGGTLVGGDTAATLTTTGPGKGFARALQFDGAADRVTTTYTAALTNFSAGCWFRYTSNAQYRRLIDKQYESGFWMGRSQSSGTQWGGGVRIASAPFGHFVEAAVNTWHRIDMTRSGTTLRIYLNGSLATTQTVSSAATDTTAVTIAASHAAADFFAGAIAGVTVHSYAISASQAAALFDGPSAGKPAHRYYYSRTLAQ